MADERVSFPLPENLSGFWLMQTVEWDEPDMGTSIVDLGWSRDGSREDYRNVGYLRTMREATLAFETLNEFLRRKPDEDPIDRFLGSEGFEKPRPIDLSVSGKGVWQKRLDERWFLHFDHDLNGTELCVTDGWTSPYACHTVGKVRIPRPVLEMSGRRNAFVERAFLAILKARLDQGDPGMALRD